MAFLFSRRHFLAGAAVAASSAAAFPKNEYSPKKLNVVVTGGHPGDPEYGCGGTICRYTDEGHRVTLLHLNRGEKGCGNQTAEACSGLRVSEARRACQVLRAQPKFADQIDGEVVVTSAKYSGN